MRRLFTATALGLLLAAAPAAAAPFETFDENDDGVLDRMEFRAAFGDAGLLERWDEDGDLRLSPDELAGALYAAWDADDDGSLTVDEWDTAVDRWFGEREVNLAVGTWDQDGDGVISEAEFTAGLDRSDLFARADVDVPDGELGSDELADGLFDLVDIDEDDALMEGEGFLADLVDDGLFDDEDTETGATLTAQADTADPPGADDVTADEDLSAAAIIERGEAFVQLPIPCGDGEGACEQTARRFCEALGYEPPIDHVAVGGSLYVIRCRDEI